MESRHPLLYPYLAAKTSQPCHNLWFAPVPVPAPATPCNLSEGANVCLSFEERLSYGTLCHKENCVANNLAISESGLDMIRK